MNKKLGHKIVHTDVLIIGGGTAGCFAAVTISRNSSLSVIIAEKANIKRSGCLAAGVNAINAYILEGRTPEDYVTYATEDAKGIVRRDLLLTAAERFNSVTAAMEEMGLVILKDDKGNYAARGNRNIKINGENFKPLLAKAVKEAPGVTVLNKVNITDLIVEDNEVKGAIGFNIEGEMIYEIRAGAVLMATGGAAGLYRPNNPGFSRHKMWYPPFNTGAGYAMGILSGAEMTTFEMRFIALRCKDTIAPTGTIAQGAGARQMNSLGEDYDRKYGITTSERLYGTVKENLEGRGPCYLKTSVVGEEKDEELLKAYLNMAPSQTLKWLEGGKNPSKQDVEISGTEPYIVGGHTASGYWVNTKRETTIKGLYAAGDVSGGCPQKYVTGALAEGEIAALDIISKLHKGYKESFNQSFVSSKIEEYETILSGENELFTPQELEEAMQKVMDEYAGGITSYYQFNESNLSLADEKISQLLKLWENLKARDMRELLEVYELRERLVVCKSVIAHLYHRKETRWHCFNENMDHKDTDKSYYKYVNSKMTNKTLKMIYRDIVEGAEYEHKD
jgi:adenylylsulfate reductase subunit A